MPRLRLGRRGTVFWLAGAIGCAALGPTVLHTALAAAAGTLFEAAPFVLAAELLPRRFGPLAVAAGCGCGRRAPGALSFAATAVCWTAFGPAVAVARLAAALLIYRLRFAPRAQPSHDGDRGADAEPDAFADLFRLAPSAAFAALATTALGGSGAVLHTSVAGRAVLFAAGVGLGIVSPCATAAVAIAAALATTAPTAAAGILMTGGLIELPRAVVVTKVPRVLREGADARIPRRAIVTRLALAVALALLVAHGAAGFVNPRLLPFAAAGAVIALAGAKRKTRSAAPALVPSLLFVALAAGSPPAMQDATATRLEDAYPGERLAFVGRAHRSGAATVLERSFITCCRADAAVVAVRMSERLPLSEATWVRATGVLVTSPEGLVLRPEHWRAIAAPADPFAYR